ncbi:O-acetyl-ADP-ribose deacetylase [Treponema sp.]|uniref:O-acetyl-ADP-ribose deacetylase n=1 Tax=Treponema sp. TaxID=166 RepID=UPI00257BD7BA|nr:O-acetyl-ADP-ribose deacetylase [Treponema sp.]MBE6354510.1 O-acetyl-ADP-ribose deacetylase [Treponema sp.]
MGKIKIIKGDITTLSCDAIVNAANSSLLGGGGVDGAIHHAAGPELLAECRTLHGCKTGEAKITKGYKLPARFVIHTVGPIYCEHSAAEAKALLTACYENSLKLARENGLKTIAFPLISAGVYGYPQRDAIRVAVETMKEHAEEFEELTLVLFGEREFGLAGEDYGEFAEK